MDERWGRYLASRDWALLKRAVRLRANNLCERCVKGRLEQVHHLTYIRKYCERLEDLQGLCRRCHEFLSAVTDEDPCEDKRQALELISPRFAAFLERGACDCAVVDKTVYMSFTFTSNEAAAFQFLSDRKALVLEDVNQSVTAHRLRLGEFIIGMASCRS